MGVDLVDAYGQILESRRASVSPESLLPGSKDAIKNAMLDTVRRLRQAGHLTDRIREQIKVAYGALATFLPDAQALRQIAIERGIEYQQAVAAVDPSLTDPIRDQLMRLVVASSGDPSWTGEMTALFEEFDRNVA